MFIMRDKITHDSNSGSRKLYHNRGIKNALIQVFWVLYSLTTFAMSKETFIYLKV